MAQSINLIPQEVKVEQQKTELVKASTVVTILLLVVVSAIAIYFYYTSTNLKRDLQEENAETENLRAQITKLSKIEITARNLDKKYTTLQKLFVERQKYSFALKSLELRTPDNIKIDDLALSKDNTFATSGIGDDYLAISDFVTYITGNDVVQTTKSEEYPELQDRKIFKDVTLNSVSLDNQSKKIKFFLVISYIKEALSR